MSERFLTDEPYRVVRCLKKARSKRINNLNVLFSRLNRFLLENKFKVSFSNMSVRYFSKKSRK